MTSRVPLTHTLEAVSGCFEKAEQTVRRDIRRKHRAADEEFITRLVHSELCYGLEKATKSGLVAQAFETDLKAQLAGRFDASVLHGLSANVFADSALHKRSVERRTGGDFGLLVIRPSIEDMGESISIDMTKQGLLCQAKLRHGKQWDSLTDTQKKVLKKRTVFLGLTLYSYSDSELTKLEPFGWQPCDGASIRTIGRWLKSGCFPAVLSSNELIKSIGSGTIGTDDPQLIESLIAASDHPVITIRIDWPPNDRPDPGVLVAVHKHIEQPLQQQVVLLNRY